MAITEDQIALPRDSVKSLTKKLMSKQESKKAILEPLASITHNSKATVVERNTDMKCYIGIPGLNSSRESYQAQNYKSDQQSSTKTDK